MMRGEMNLLRRLLKSLIFLCLLIIIIIFLTNLLVGITTKNNIIELEEVQKLENVDCILVLGAGIRNHYPSPMLEDRLKQAITLYETNVSPKILVSGDHMQKNYDEVNVMKDYLLGNTIPSQDIFMDHAGISTYDSIYRAKEIFQAKKIIIVTQKYHLYRALYIAKQLDLEAYGVSASTRTYVNQEKRELRELLARTKDFFKTIFKPTSTYLGDPIPITGNGDITNDTP